MTIEQLYQLFLEHPSVEIDTRKLTPGDIFFALSGPNFNGNQFALQALAAGASYVVVDENIDEHNDKIIQVDHALCALQDLAKYHRQQLNIPVIAITGSNGKTTTKELVNAVLATHLICYTTPGNLNNHIGIPLTLLRIQKDAEITVIEMGANHQGEIAGYCDYVQPTHGIITNCGKAHLEGFGGVEGVRKGKGELFDYIRQNNGMAFIFNDYDYLQEMASGIDQFNYGTAKAEVIGTAKSQDSFLNVAITAPFKAEIHTRLVGDYNLPNVLCAVAVGVHFKVPHQKIKQAIEAYEPGNSRSQMLIKGTNHIILDAYNANPSSMVLAIENLAKIEAGNKIILLGAMLELGAESLQEHQNIIDTLQKHSWQQVVLVGGDFAKLKHHFLYFDTSQQAAAWYRLQHFHNTHQLIKGSRSMQMEKVLQE